ncbi:hypothetical protein LQT97_12825 [Brucella pseudogrignonensis]|uniref:hypothetical protein n=1 Tax=Brucella pseudogrignonensis TaxID=419475 RepID=UPI001E578C78|nr:hypothetical protein [Brucella pseudogrignonensis]MCD4512112.1 hypothetical protein [Brucella pseudogrignonensis]
MQQETFTPPIFNFDLTGQWRLISFVPVVALLFCGAVMLTMMAGSKVWWWSLWMITPPAIVAALLAIGLSRMKVTLDATGLRLKALGYSVSAPWSDVTVRSNPRLSATLNNPSVSLSTWIAWTLPVLKAVMPWRARYAEASMRSVALWYFDDGTLSTAITKASKANSKPEPV